MKNGNVTFLSRLHLCLFLLAVLPQIKAQTTPMSATCNAVFSASVSSSGSMVTIAKTIQLTGTSLGHSVGFLVVEIPRGTAYATFPVLTVSESYGLGTYRGNDTTSMSGRPSGTYYVVGYTDYGRVNGYPNGVVAASFTWDGSSIVGAVSNTVVFALKNNLNRAQTISVGNAASQTLPPLSSTTLTFSVSGAQGDSVLVSTSPDGIIYDTNYDPIIIGPAGSSISRSAHFGLPPQKVHIRVVIESYATLPLTLTPVLDGGHIGSILADPSFDGGKSPEVTSYDYDVELSSSSSLSFTAPAGHVVETSATIGATTWTYMLVVDAWAQVTGKVTSTAGPTPDGTVTVTTTDTTTGTTTITHSNPTQGTNTNTSPSGAFGGTSTSGNNQVVVYNNTTTAAGSAASQDAANSLSAIAKSTAQTAANTQDGASVAKKQLADENGARGALTSLQTEANATDLISTSNARANNMKANAQTVVSQFGTMPTTTAQGSDPSDPTVDLKISATKTITMHLNPFSSAGPFGGVIGTVAGLIKRLIAWGIVMTFLITVMKEMRYVLGVIFLTNPNQSQILDALNNVRIFGNSLGVPVSVTLRVALTAGLVALFLTVPLVISAAVEAGLPWTALVATATAGPIGTGAPTMVQTAIGYASLVVPWVTLMCAPVYYFVLHAALFPAQAFWQMLMKALP